MCICILMYFQNSLINSILSRMEKLQTVPTTIKILRSSYFPTAMQCQYLAW